MPKKQIQQNYITEADRMVMKREKVIPFRLAENFRYHQLEKLSPFSFKNSDLAVLLGFDLPVDNFVMAYETLEDLFRRDKQREKDGFKPKIKMRQISVAGRVKLLPYVEEEKFVHSDPVPEDEAQGAGHAEGEEGDTVGEAPLSQGGEEGEEGEEGDPQEAGEGGGGEHGIDEEDAYRYGEWLSDKFQLPNMQDKSKKVPVPEKKIDIAGLKRGSGVMLDPVRTLIEILRTNIALGRVDPDNIDTTKFIVDPEDEVYYRFSEEQVYQSMAVVFFVRDYSGSMSGDPTRIVCSQHVMFYCWLMYQYKKLVIPIFILHDAEAKQVPNFHRYINSQVAGGTKICTAYQLVNRIIEEGNLASQYNIYVFAGTDGDDWDESGEETIKEMEKLVERANRIGITVARHNWSRDRTTTFEKYMQESGLLKEHSAKIRLDVIPVDEGTDTRILEGAKKLLAP